jgi:hypothetical protein
MTAPQQNTAGTAAAAANRRGPASHVVVDVVDSGVGGATPVRQTMHSLGVEAEKPSTSPVLLLSGGIVVAATVVSAGVVNMAPAFAALIFAAIVVILLRYTTRRARRTDVNTKWASRSGEAFGAWDPAAPRGRQRLLIDQRGLAVVDLGVHREPLAVLLWKSVERMIVVPGNERTTDPGIVVHRTDGSAAVFTTSFNLHEMTSGLAKVGVTTDIEQAITGATAVRRHRSPLGQPQTPPAPEPPVDPWSRVSPPVGVVPPVVAAALPEPPPLPPMATTNPVTSPVAGDPAETARYPAVAPPPPPPYTTF